MFSNNILLDQDDSFIENEEISKNEVFADLKKQKLCWNFDQLKLCKADKIVVSNETEDELQNIILEIAENNSKSKCFTEETLNSLNNLVHQIYHC